MSELGGCVEFLERLIRTPSLPGAEGEVAEIVAREMRRLGYDEVSRDEAGNVLGRIEGAGRAQAVMFNTHLDHVDAGDPQDWAHPPFGGEIHDGRLWGRGAVDIKGPLAAQVHGIGRLAAAGPPPGDVWVTAVVQEEVGGLGARHLAERLPSELVVVGEPSRNELRRGHRGRVELLVRFRGRMAHASAPERGVNPLRPLAGFLRALEDLELPDHPDLGRSTLVPTLIGTDQTSPNVIPGEARVTCDCRTVPGQDAESVRQALLPLVEAALSGEERGEVLIPSETRRSFTGLEGSFPSDNPPFSLPEGHPALESAAEVLAPVLGRRPPVSVWRFATDGGHFARAGRTVVGFGPGEEELAHTVRESIALADLETAVAANEALGREWPSAYAERA